MKARLTPLGGDGAVGDDDDGPVELGFEVLDDLLGGLAESGEAAEGNADLEGLGGTAVGLLVINQISTVDVDLRQSLLQTLVVHL